MLHCMYAGEQYDWDFATADVSMHSTDEQVKQATATLLGIPATKFQGWLVVRDVEGELTLRPNAVFGLAFGL